MGTPKLSHVGQPASSRSDQAVGRVEVGAVGDDARAGGVNWGCPRPLAVVSLSVNEVSV